MRKQWTSVTTALILVALCTSPAEDKAAHARERPVPCRRIGASEYQNFIKNWDTDKHPVLCALIGTATQYEALFHPAPLMGRRGKTAPDPELYTKEMIVVVARVTTAPDDLDKVFELEQMTEADGRLTVRYKFHEPRTKATYAVKVCLALRIPKNSYRKVIFTENGRHAGEIDVASGQWVVPEEARKPQKR